MWGTQGKNEKKGRRPEAGGWRREVVPCSYPVACGLGPLQAQRGGLLTMDWRIRLVTPVFVGANHHLPSQIVANRHSST